MFLYDLIRMYFNVNFIATKLGIKSFVVRDCNNTEISNTFTTEKE